MRYGRGGSIMGLLWSSRLQGRCDESSSNAAVLLVSEPGPPQHPAAGPGPRRPAGQVLRGVCGRLQRDHRTHLQVSSPLGGCSLFSGSGTRGIHPGYPPGVSTRGIQPGYPAWVSSLGIQPGYPGQLHWLLCDSVSQWPVFTQGIYPGYSGWVNTLGGYPLWIPRVETQ